VEVWDLFPECRSAPHFASLFKDAIGIGATIELKLRVYPLDRKKPAVFAV
jgi:hypothetical protein